MFVLFIVVFVLFAVFVVFAVVFVVFVVAFVVVFVYLPLVTESNETCSFDFNLLSSPEKFRCQKNRRTEE